MRRLDGKVAVVTGASRGIGKAVAFILAQQGAGVLALARSASALKSLAATPIIGGGWIRAFPLDVRRRAELRQVVGAAEVELGHIDLLVNNAGWERQKPLELQTDEDYDATIETNFGAAAWLIQIVLPGMKRRRSGWIVNVASTAGLRGFKDVALYSASKFALIGLTNSLEEEVRVHGIHVSAICPGWTDTELANDAGLHDQRYLTQILRPEDVAEAVLYVVSQPEHVAVSRVVIRPLVERPYSGLLPLDDLLGDGGNRGEAVSAYRPTIMGTQHVISAGHYLAAQAGFEILEAGGNAIDAGVAAGIALGIVQSDIVNFAGVAPMIFYLAATQEVLTISGLGPWPRAASVELFEREHDGHVPPGLLRTVVPAAPDAWIRALKRYGTMSFGDVVRRAIRFAADGFAMYPLMADSLASQADDYRRWPTNSAIYLPNGRSPSVGDIFVQSDLAGTLQYMVDEEAAAQWRGREAGLNAARNAFYRGDIAAAMVRFQRINGGLLTEHDLADFRSEIEPPVVRQYYGRDVFTCGAWCQGPVLLQMLSLLEPIDLASMGQNSPHYLHILLEAMKLAFADRERYYGDPRFVEVPIDGLLSNDYAARRRGLISPNRAWQQMPPAGELGVGKGVDVGLKTVAGGSPGPIEARDTSYVCVVDSSGNVFSATPSDDSSDAPVTPGTGLCVSSRGSQSWGIRGHASAVAPGKRPRLTPNPALIADPARQRFVPLGSPGGDVQAQAMLQAFLNMCVFGMTPQEAVEAPRVVTYSFPDSFEPHDYRPGLVKLESRIPQRAGELLAAWGHCVEWWPDLEQLAGAVCLIDADRRSHLISGAADPRRPAYALGW